MKKILSLACVLLLAMASQAQPMKVAILEPINKANDVPYAVKQMVRSSFTAAISSTPGFEGYDRVNMNAIFNEQEFQRTGNVSDDQIRQIGVATGAAYVLVTEVSKYDANNIVITATILDVETFGVKKSKWEVCNSGIKDVKATCEDLTRQVLELPAPEPISEPEPEPKKKDILRPTGSSIRLAAGVPFFSISYNHFLTPSWMVGGGIGISWGTRKELYYNLGVYSHSYYGDGPLMIPVFAEFEWRTPKYRWSFFINVRMGVNIPTETKDYQDHVEHNNSANFVKVSLYPFYFTSTIGVSYKNFSFGTGYYNGGIDGIPVTAYVAFNIPINTK